MDETTPLRFSRLRIAGFVVEYTQSIRCPETQDLILLDMTGPHTSIRAAWASLRGKKQYHFALGGRVKMNKDPGHTILKQQLPCGYHNWTIIANQAIPNKAIPDTFTYVWDRNPNHGRYHYDDSEIEVPPPGFMPMFTATTPFPTRPEWATYLWNAGRDKRRYESNARGNQLIIRLPDSNQCAGYRIINKPEWWKEIIETGVHNGDIR